MTDTIVAKGNARLIDERPRTPSRRPDSIRRTTTVTMYRPSGWEGPLLLEGRGRDVLTPKAGGQAITLREERMSVEIARPDMIVRLATTPDWPEAQALVGHPAIAGYRRRLSEQLADRADREGPLGTLLDDIAACTLISGWILLYQPGSYLYGYTPDPARRSRMASVCVGLSAASTVVQEPGKPPEPVQVGDVRHPDDAEGWHAMAAARPFEMRRARRIDVWREEDRLMVDAMFQDSALLDDGTRRAVHDYGLHAAFDAHQEALLAIECEPRILPYDGCSRAAEGGRAMIGTTASTLRSKVLEELRGAAGCTHLNDAMRSLAAVPWLGRQLTDDAGGTR